MKKRKIIDLPKPTLELLARCAAVLKPPPALTLSEWADRYRVLSAESSAEPGRWHTDKAPYQREIMDAIGDPHIRKVVIMSAAQIGKTDAFILNPLGYYMDYAPAPILVMQPTLDMGQTFSKDRLAPMIRDTPELRDKIDVKSRYSGNTIMKKNFPGGHITIVGANSATGLASRPIKVLLADEVDRYPASAGTEGDPLSLAQKRQTTFWDKKTVIVSTPVIKGQSRIETEFNQSTREEWNVPCPECGHYQPFVWANVVFDKDDPQGEVLYKCERCGVVNGEYQWKQASKRGRFVPENPGAEARGFHLNTLASTFCSWKEIVQKFLVAKEQLDQGNPEGMKVWVNTELGETWEEQGEQVEDAALLNRRELYDADVPEGVLVLTAGVDVQDDRFEVEVVGWGIGKESWGIRYQKIYGDMLKEQVWQDLDNFLLGGFKKKDGAVLHIMSACIDTGGHHTDQVYRFTAERWERKIWSIKGKGGADVPYIRNPTTNNRVKTPLFIIGVDAGKALLYQRLRHETKGPNYCHFPLNEEAGYDEQYFIGLTAEKMVVRWRKGRSVVAWELKDSKHKRNEPLDLRNYATAALKTMRTNVVAGGLMPAPQLDSDYLGLDEAAAEKLQAQIVREFALWADTPVCDAERMDNFYQLQQLAFLSYLMNGDTIALLPMKHQAGVPYDLRVRLIEADRVCSPDGFDRLMPCTVQGYEVQNIVQGVETDADGMVTAYWICNRHPLGNNSAVDAAGLTWQRVEAYGDTTGRRNVLHIMSRERIGQRRGVPLLAPVLESLKQLGR